MRRSDIITHMIDTHCHLTDPFYAGGGDVIKNMKRDGLEALVTVGYDTATSVECARIAAKNKGVYAAVGLHPSELDHENGFDGILPLLNAPKIVALGEIGLDYHWDNVPRERQKEYLLLQLELACKCGKPVIIHSRECDGDMLPILKSYAKKLTAPLVMHCFSSSEEIAREYVKLGFYISFAGTVTFKNAKKGDVIRAVPDELLLAETDAPYLTPVPHRGERNYPAYVRFTIEKIAEERGKSFGEIERLTSDNARRFYGITETL